MSEEVDEIVKKHMGNPKDPIAKLLADSQGNILALNPAFEKAFGYSQSELIGRKVEVLLPPEAQDNHIKLREDYVAHDPRTRFMGRGRHLYGIHKDGSKVNIDLGLEPIKVGDHTYVIATLTGL